MQNVTFIGMKIGTRGFLGSLIEAPESRTGRALENAYKYCPSGYVTCQISKLKNIKVRELALSKKIQLPRTIFFQKDYLLRKKINTQFFFLQNSCFLKLKLS